jgi:hypothetical protein
LATDDISLAATRLAQHEPLVNLEDELSALLALQGSARLSAGTRGYICDALLLAILLGWTWPSGAPFVDDTADPSALCEVANRWTARTAAAPIRQRFHLAQVGRLLQTAIFCEQDPDALDGRLHRDLLQQHPALGAPPPPFVLPDGRVL